MGWDRYLGSPGGSPQSATFVVPELQFREDTVKALYEGHYIKSEKAFTFLLNNFGNNEGIKPGGYYLTRNMTAWAVMKKLTDRPELSWVTISFCARKEQIGEKLADALGWNSDQLTAWDNLYKDGNMDYYEGVYYPDTYLIPVGEDPAATAKRFIDRFNEEMAPIYPEYAAKNVKWTTGLKIASLIGREAAGKSDMNLISGVIWNRLDQGIRLQIDATLQYAKSEEIDGSWWNAVSPADKKIDSPYNSYLNKGLPPTPICSPNIDEIKAALNPENTDCLYYLHDKSKEIHCAVTYAEHLANIEKYLK